MKPVEIESDPFLTLLSEALRAGPGSPQWHQAVSKLRADGPQQDEFALLCAAREHLESGKEFRTVRAGPGFTRKLFADLEQERGKVPGRLPTATLVAAACALAILVVLGLVAYWLTRAPDTGRGAIEDLAGTYFPTDALSATFDGAVPAGLRPIGALPMDASKGLRPSAGAPAGTYAGGGLVVSDPLPAIDPLAVEATLTPMDAQGTPAEIFVSDSADFSADRATSPHELVWLLKNQEQQVIVDGRGQGGGPLPSGGPLTLRIVVGPELAVVEVGGRRLWAGPHGLGRDKPRYVGVRFLRAPGESGAAASVQSLRVLQPGRAARGER